MKTKFLKSMSIILALILVMCTLAACTKNLQNTIVGKWYDPNGKCLDIRSDGTYKLEDDYGTGTWKYLDDGKTIELTDYLGSTIETNLQVDEKGSYIDLGYWGKFYNEKEIKDKEERANGITVTITNASPFYNDRALIEYEDLNKNKYIALIDNKGNIIKKFVDENQITDFAFGMAYIGDTLFDKNGKEIMKGNVVAIGENAILVSEYQEDINGKKYDFKVVDKNGKCTQEVELPEVEYLSRGFSYAGCGIFQCLIKESDRRTEINNDLLLFNAKTGNKTILSIGSEIEFINDIAVYKDEFNTYYSITADFTEKTIGKFKCNSENYLVSTDKENIIITNIENDKSVELKEYSSEQFISLEYKGNFGLIKLKGKEGGNYFTVIDKEGNTLFEPRNIPQFIYFDGEKIVCMVKKGNWGGTDEYEILNVNGEKVSDFKLENKIVKGIENDIIIAEHDFNVDGYCYVDLKGNTLFEMLYE